MLAKCFRTVKLVPINLYTRIHTYVFVLYTLRRRRSDYTNVVISPIQ